MEYTLQETCRICNGKVKNVFNLGEIYPSNFVDKTEGTPVSLILVECEDCHLVQQKYTVSLDSMYRNYFYQSAINPSMVKSLQEIVTEIENTVEIGDLDVLVDIGCNDGTLLSLYKNKVAFKLGYDPALNLKDTAEKNCTEFVNDYFSKTSYYWNKAKVVTAIAMFYDLPDPNKFVKDVYDILADDGVFVIQFTDLVSMLRTNAFDNICHEHLEYYKLKDIRNLLSKFGLTIFKVSYNAVNGGSIRIFAGKNDYALLQTTDSVYKFLLEEEGYLSSPEGSIEAFYNRVQNIKKIVLEFLIRSENGGLRIFGLGASTKGNTLLQYFGINKNLLKVIAEINPDKFGKVTIGTEIPIISEDEAFDEYPDIYFILPWHFVENIVMKNPKYLEDGGAFVVPLPEPRIYYYAGGALIWILLEKVLP